MCNNILFTSGNLKRMHETARRLYLAAKELKKLEGQSAIARALTDTSPQTVKNWEKRGVSKAAMLDAELKLGCSATWLETGQGSMQAGSRTEVREPTAEYLVEPASAESRLRALLEEMQIIPDEADEIIDQAMRASEKSQKVLATFGKLSLPRAVSAERTNHIPPAPKWDGRQERRKQLGEAFPEDMDRRSSKKRA